MTTLFFVRHGVHDLSGLVLVGRSGPGLNAAGREQAQWLGGRLLRENVDVVKTSPQQRTRDTADLIAQQVGRAAEIASALDEVNVGDWAGHSFAALESDSRWKQWNVTRSMARPPNGETMLEVQMRVVGHVENIRARNPQHRVVLVTHSDVIRAGLLYYLGLPVDSFWRIEIDPGSLTTLVVEEWGAKLTSLNEVKVA